MSNNVDALIALGTVLGYTVSQPYPTMVRFDASNDMSRSIVRVDYSDASGDVLRVIVSQYSCEEGHFVPDSQYEEGHDMAAAVVALTDNMHATIKL